MQISTTPYLSVLRTQLAGDLRPKDDKTAQQVNMYFHRILTQLLLHAQLVPELKQKAAGELAALLNELNTELRDLESGAALMPPLELHLHEKPDYAAAEPLVQQAAQLLAAHPSTARRKLLKNISAIVMRVQDAIHQAALKEEMQPIIEGDVVEPLTTEQKLTFQNYLRSKFPAESALEVGTTKAVVGGGSKQTLFIELRNAKTLPATVVLRIDQAASPTGATVADEFDIMKAMFVAGMPVPQPFVLEVDTSIMNACFIVVSRIDGHNIGDALDVTEPSRAFGVDLARTMAKLHQIPMSPGGDRLHGAKVTTRERMQADIADFEAKWRALNEPLIALELAYAWLKEHMDFAEGQRAIVHRDIGCHNMLAKDGRLAALLDWETAVIGNPAQDLAYAYHTVVQMMPWEEFLAEYEKAGGKRPRNEEIDYYRVWRSVWLVGFQLLARSYFLSGATSAMILAYASQYWYQRVEHDLHEMVDMVYRRY
jgi:aminoglycoside phosphotransferase (APT) family kinase protein